MSPVVLHRCPDCQEQVVRATGPQGEIVLDPRVPVAAVYVRSATAVDAWPTTEAMVIHASICPARAARRTFPLDLAAEASGPTPTEADQEPAPTSRPAVSGEGGSPTP